MAFALLAAGSFLSWLAAPAAAHARLSESSPGDDEMLYEVPTEVVLHFDEVVEVTDNAVRVLNPDGDEVQEGAPTLDDGDTTVAVDLDPGLELDDSGTYTVAWRVTSLDTHVVEGSFVFHLGEQSGAVAVDDGGDSVVDAAGLLGRWLGFVGSVTLVGTAALALFTTGEPRAQARWRLLAFGGGAVAVLGVALALASRVAEVAGVSLVEALGRLPGAVGDARSTELLGWRLVALVVASGLVAVGGVWRRAPWAPLAVGLVSCVVAASAGHAWTSDTRALAVTSDAVHFGAVSVWAGGLVALLVGLPLAEQAGALARRLSALALVAVVAVALSGVVLGWQHLGGLGNLTATGYGRMLMAKVALFAVLVGLGWLNRARLVATVERTLAPLTRSLRVELALVAVVLAVTAALVNEPPGSTPSGEDDAAVADDQEYTVPGAPFSGTVMGESEDATFAVELDLDVVPADVGVNQFHMDFLDADGDPLAMLVAQAEVAQGDMPPREVEISLLSPSHAFADGVAFPSPGDWTVTVTAIPVDSDEPVRFTFEVPIT